MFANVASRIIKAKLLEQLVDGIRYEQINEWYEMTQFAMEIEGWEEYLVPSRRPDSSEGASIYDHVVAGSGIEIAFAEGMEKRADVKLYIKLPSWFTVPTPIGEYNPDWAIVMDNPDGAKEPLLYLVRETKDPTDTTKLRPSEDRKIRCGALHFTDALHVNYKVVKSASELP